MIVKTLFCILLIASAAILIECHPASSVVRKKVSSRLRSGRNLGVGGNRRSIVVPDYWAERGFHEALTDHFLASEAQAKDFMLAGDEIEDFRGKPQIRIPRERLTPPELPDQEAKRKQDMEIMESITLVDGGTHMPDGSIKVRPNAVQYQRKYQDGPSDERYNPLNYHLQDEQQLKLQQQQQQAHQRQPLVSTSFHTLKNGYLKIGGKESAFQKTPNVPLSVQFQQQILHEQQQQEILRQQKQQEQLILQQKQQEQLIQQQKQQEQIIRQQQQQILLQQQQRQQQQHHQQQILQQQQQHKLLQQQPPAPLYSAPPTSPDLPPAMVVIPPPKLQTHLFKPLPQQPPALHQPPQPPQLQPQSFNQQLFQQQFQHPFSPPTPPPNSLAQLTASLASSAAAVASTLAKNAVPLPTSAISPLQTTSIIPSSPFTSLFNLAAAASQTVPAKLVSPTSTPSISTSSTTLRVGVVPDDESLLQNQVGEPESLAVRLTKVLETGRKILYFPKGVVDTVDQMLKQVERNPMVAYWGDKFFAKVFGDTSQT